MVFARSTTAANATAGSTANVDLNVVFGGLQFLPDGLVSVVRASPWSAMAQLPAEVFLERQGAGGVLAAQLAWALVLQGVALLMVQRATRKLVIQGG